MKKKSQKLERAAVMPYLPHSPPAGQPFDWSTSEVADWLTRQPELRQYLFDRCVRAGVIVYNKPSGMWHGRDVKGELDL